MGRIIEAQRWFDPDGNDRAPGSVPNPFTDANDCEALIAHINSLGWSVVVDWQHDDPKHAPGVWIEFYHFETEIHERIRGMDRDRWKQGVCELALKVLS